MFGVDLSIILLIVVGLFAFAGFWFGFMHTVGALIGTIAGSFLASRFHEVTAAFLQGRFELADNTAQVMGFILVFVVVSRLFGVAVWIAEKVINLSGVVPFFGMLNRMAGAILGVIEGVLIVGLILSFTMKFPITDTWKPDVQESGVAQTAMLSSKLLWPLVTDGLSFFQTLPEEIDF